MFAIISAEGGRCRRLQTCRMCIKIFAPTTTDKKTPPHLWALKSRNCQFLFQTVCFYGSNIKIWCLKLCYPSFERLKKCSGVINPISYDDYNHWSVWLCLSFQNSQLRKTSLGLHIRKYYSLKLKALRGSPNKNLIMIVMLICHMIEFSFQT